MQQSPAKTPARRVTARERLLAAAARVFYADGIHSTPVDRIIEEAGVTRATFYRHFPSKEALVVAYVEARDTEVRRLAGRAAEAYADPADLLRTLVDAVADEMCGPAFRGCLFINAAAEYPDPAHPVRQAVAAHRSWLRATLAELLARTGHPDPEEAAALLVMARDGAMVAGYLETPASARARLSTAVASITGPRPGH
ncbi:TetR/AcrR family transcriptional regulator [Streptomyces sp. NPDC059761]|uniref:TetR/AcrR family transcriptional regulator n=1 Tax=Streptomyces sp. NPDC059761 TaxID=3346937 RepID=UPI00364619A8